MRWDHNPLLMKGASISYGTTTCSGMAVHKTGMVTYGVGFNNDNGEYFWNDDENMGGGVALGKWVQHTPAADQKQPAATATRIPRQAVTPDAPDFDSEIRNWEGKSMYSGFAFHRHLLTGRRPRKTHHADGRRHRPARFTPPSWTAEGEQADLRKSDCKGSGKRQDGRMAEITHRRISSPRARTPPSGAQ